MAKYNVVSNVMKGETAESKSEAARMATALEQMSPFVTGPAAENAICPDRHPVDSSGAPLIYREPEEPAPLPWWAQHLKSIRQSTRDKMRADLDLEQAMADCEALFGSGDDEED